MSFAKKHTDWSILFVRLAIGIIFLTHGIGKLFNVGPFAAGIAGVSGFLASLGVPAAMFFATLVALVETVGGAFLILGLFVRCSALILAIDIAFALILVHIPSGFYESSGELPLALLLGAISLYLSGAGKRWVLMKEK